MSYLVLARKSRPQTFDQVVGQRSVVKTLQNSLRRDRVAHAILFSGVRGVGKTTLARIMAKAINCTGETETPPCDNCDSCKQITAGNALDLVEIDGASNRGIQEIRELKEKIKFMPTSCRYKVIIIDEVHMLTTEAFNALLKTLEEPPSHVYFMFATTELHKIPITILSRCQQYELKRISAAELGSHFQKLAQDEGVTIEPGALSLIVRESEGSVRDGLSLLDQVFSYGETNISVEDVTEVLGLVNRDILLKIVASLLANDKGAAISGLEQLFTFGIDLKRFSSDLLECFRTLLLLKIEGCQNIIDLPEDDKRRFEELGNSYSAESIHLKLNLLMNMVEETRYTSQPRLAMETGFLKIMEAGNVVPVSEILEKFQILLNNIGEEPASHESPPSRQQDLQQQPKKKIPAPQPEIQKPEPVISDTPPPPTEPPPVADLSTSMEKPDTVPAEEPPPALEPPQTTGESQPETVVQQNSSDNDTGSNEVEAHPHKKDIRRHWQDFLLYVKDRKVWMSQVLNRVDSFKEEHSELHLHYKDPNECAVLREKENKKLLTEFVLDFFQKELTLHFILPSEEEETNGGNGHAPLQRRHELQNDPLSIMTAEIFSGQVTDIRVGPRSR